MGLLDRVKQNQTGVPVAGPASNGPAAAAAPGGASSYSQTSVAQRPSPTATAPPVNAAPRAPAVGEAPPAFTAAKVQIHAKLIERFADQIDSSNKAGVREKITELADEYFRTTAMTMTKTDKERLVDSVLDDVLGLGPLEALLADPNITEIMANHPKQIYVEKSGEPALSAVTFESDRQMRQVIDRIVSLVGRRVDESTPICDARLKDGSRVNVVIPPIALKGPCLTIRKFTKEKWGPTDIVNRFHSASPELMTFLRSCVRARFNILVSGGTGSGKTTLLNILSSFIPETERLITCEDAAELQLQQPHWIQLESRPPNVEGKGAVPIRELVKSCLRMRPDRIIVGECRGGEALDMLQAMNTGHDGSMSTLHANNPHEALVRLETLVLQAGQDLPSRAIRETIGAAIHLIVQQSRLRGGIRRIVSVAEVIGMKDGDVQYQEIFLFKQLGVSPEGKAVGYHTATGVIPMRMEHLKSEGEDVPESLFNPTPQPPPDKLY
ncbi:MAG: pilus assembly protein CpaF [Chloroflexota bacterium]|jgi:pilus assembly protein CpaF|nr:pilus assembly protein CpaF [Chloroflexota bacterium]